MGGQGAEVTGGSERKGGGGHEKTEEAGKKVGSGRKHCFNNNYIMFRLFFSNLLLRIQVSTF